MKRHLRILCFLLALCCLLVACDTGTSPAPDTKPDSGTQTEQAPDTGKDQDTSNGQSGDNGGNNGEESTTVVATGVTLDKTAVQLFVGDTATLVATVAPANATDKSVTWATSNASVATVQGGTVTALGAGTATITVTTANGKSASCVVTVVTSGIAFKTLTREGTNVYGKVPNVTTTFSFLSEVSVNGNATFEVFRDLECENLIRSKTVSLEIGDNTYYILEYVNGDINSIYTVTVRRKPMYTVSFDSKGGSAVQSQSIEEDAPVVTPTAPTKTGYTFAGWSRDLALPVTEAITIDATWTANGDTAYTVKHYIEKLDGTDELKDTDNLTGTSDADVTPVTKSYTGFTAPATQTVTVSPDGSRVVEYHYTRNSYTVSFVTNGGEAIANITLKYEQTYVLEDAVRTGYTFAGWFEDAALTSAAETMPAHHVTLYAAWTANGDTAYTVKHYIEKLDGTYEVRDTDNLFGTSDTEVTPVTKSYTGFTAPATQTVTISPDGSRVVEYRYTRNSYTVSFVTNGGEAIANITLKYEQPYVLEDAVRTGYTFAGWFEDAALTSAAETMPAHHVTLYAAWTANGDTAYTVKHYIEKLDGTYELKDTDNLAGTSDAEVTPVTKSYTGFTAPVKQTVTISPDGTRVVEYRYTRNSYTVSFNAKGGSSIATQTLKYEQVYTFTTPTRTGFTFANWYYGTTPISLTGNWTIAENVTLEADWTANDDTAYTVEHYIEKLDGTYELKDTDNLFGTSDAEVTPVTKSYTGFTAPATQTVTVSPDGTRVVEYRYTRNSYTVSFNAKGGSAIADITLKYEQTYVLEDAVRTGYTFGGWYCDNAPFDASGTWTLTKNITVVAAWTANSGIPYKVKHYIEKLNGAYELKDTDNLFGTSDTKVTPVTKSYTGFTAPAKQTVTVSPDGTRVVGYYYTRNRYTVSFVTNGGNNIATQTLKYGAALPAPVRSGFTFGGWFEDVALTVAAETVPAQNMTLYAHWAEENKPGDFTYTGTSEITITGYTAEDMTVGVPSYIGGVAVTSIAKGIFNGCSLESLILPFVGASLSGSSNTHFGYIFGVSSYSYNGSYVPTSLKTVVITGGTSIGSYAFYACMSLTSITFGENSQLTSIGEKAFSNCTSLTSVTFGENSQLTSIGKMAFYYCTSLKSINIPASVTGIGEDAFDNCKSLTGVYITDIAAWCKISFRSSYANPLRYAEKLYLNGTLVTDLVIPSGVTDIGNYAFEDCTSLTSINIPASVTGIGSYAFSACRSLTSVTFGENSQLTYIGSYAFSGCWSLKSINIPAGVTIIREEAFQYCESLTSINIPASVTNIGRYAFRGSTSLTSVTFENTEGWMCSSTSISATDLANASTAATYLTSTYYNYYWNRS